MKFLKALILVMVMPLSTYSQTIDTQNSNVSFAVRNMKVRTVTGTFSGMKGEVNFDKTNLSSSNFNVCVDAGTVNTDNKIRDEHLKNEDFFDVEKYPTICFISESIEESENKFLVTGNLTMHGVTKKETISLLYKENMFTGTFKIDRTDYGVGGNGGFSVAKEIEITINCKLN